MGNSWSLDDPLWRINNQTAWTLRNAVEGVQIFGGIGSGKTSGSGAFLARKYINKNYGGIVLTAKRSETKLWIDYCREANREKDLIILTPGGDYCFNFLDYEATRPKEKGGGLTDNIANLFKTIIEIDEIARESSEKDQFWENALNMLLYNSIDLCLLAHGRLTIDILNDCVRSIPPSRKALDNPAYIEKTPFGQAWQKLIDIKCKSEVSEEIKNFDRLKTNIQDYFKYNHIELSDKTRSIIDYSFMGLMLKLTRDPIYSLLCSPHWNVKDTPKKSVYPEDCIKGKIIVLDLPVNDYKKVGRDAQVLFKYIWQHAMLSRDIDKNPRPVFLWADESQNFIHSFDVDYQAVSREQRICTVYLSQNISNYFNKLGNEHSVNSFLGTVGTKIFHANTDPVTNYYASNLIGQAIKQKASQSKNIGKNPQLNIGIDYIKDPLVEPEKFSKLKTGGSDNDYVVSAYGHKQGSPWPGTDDNHKLLSFKQK